jgi:hypothetical protein
MFLHEAHRVGVYEDEENLMCSQESFQARIQPNNFCQLVFLSLEMWDAILFVVWHEDHEVKKDLEE